MQTTPTASALPDPASLLQADSLPITWQGRPLFPWSAGRDMLYLALTQHLRTTQAWLITAENDLEMLPLIEAAVKQQTEADTTATAEEKAALDPDALIDWTRFAPAAARVLWLASTDHNLLRAMAPDTMAEAIALWEPENLPTEHLRAAVRLALRLRTEWKQLVVLPRPEKASQRAAGGHAGN